MKNEDKHELSDLKGDWGNIAILFFLYLLQGIPIGLAAAVPMLLQNRGASYKQQVKENLPANNIISSLTSKISMSFKNYVTSLTNILIMLSG